MPKAPTFLRQLKGVTRGPSLVRLFLGAIVCSGIALGFTLPGISEAQLRYPYLDVPMPMRISQQADVYVSTDTSTQPYIGYCGQIRVLCQQQTRIEQQLQSLIGQMSIGLGGTSLSACRAYGQYCGALPTDTTPIDISCQPTGTCRYGSMCGAGSTCTGYPDYQCVSQSCRFPVSPVLQPIPVPTPLPTQPVSLNTSCNCGNTYEPVCTKDGRTFNNQCEARCAGVILYYPITSCQPDDQQDFFFDDDPPVTIPDNSCVCTQVYDPVCSTTGYTYSNACLARCAGQTVAYRGQCRAY